MGWIFEVKEKNLFFTNEETSAHIKSFAIECDGVTNRPKLTVICSNEGKEKIISSFSTDNLVESFLNSIDSSASFTNKYIITDGFVIENTILAINNFYYILREHRAFIRTNFGLPNLFYNENKAGRIAVALAMTKGFDIGYQYAKKELERTQGESSCMTTLAEHDTVFAEKISARNTHRYGEFSLIWLAAKKVPADTTKNIPEEVDDILEVVKKFR